ncbi:hypothetical protein EJV47_07300 [Hymenobacter gummosus]|uniref:Uncharacterized protein n=1 Tax=Hymenobacter gummosus TaxID=1776032 RepID=A0A3S0K725_9BACT|nr:hypothetical protein [Hymenobacter gummosus]RTQ51598.1 hypothetical protein EJV47_07300 [Hymenobacter gummosus]
MHLYFALTSPLLEVASDANPFVMQLARADDALLRTDGGQQALRVERIGETLLHRLLFERVRGIRPRHYADQLARFDGGLHLETAAGTLDFQCCGDLGDVAEWEQLLTPSAEWLEIWIGHPWVYARVDAETVYISEYYDYKPAPADIELRLRLPRAEFAAALQAAIAGLHQFFHRLRRVVLSHPAFDNKLTLLAVLTDGYFPATEPLPAPPQEW